LAGRHEPGSGGSFYLSLATAALRAVLVVAAVVLGVFVLSRAFPSDDQVTPPTTPGQGEPTSPAPTSPSATETPDGEQPVQETHDPAEIRMQILNGTEVGGLAADTQATLEDAGWNVVTVGDAQNKPVEITIITFARRYRADAEVLEAEFFPGAELQQAAPDADADITVTLGVDYAEAQGAA
jgi:hypothetical protein